MRKDPTLQSRINELIDSASRKRGRKFSDREIGDHAGCAHTVIYNLRHGVRSDTQSHILSAIEDFLGGPPGYLTKWATQRDPKALQVALRAYELSPEGIEAVQDFISHIERLEARARAAEQVPPKNADR